MEVFVQIVLPESFSPTTCLHNSFLSFCLFYISLFIYVCHPPPHFLVHENPSSITGCTQRVGKVHQPKSPIDLIFGCLLSHTALCVVVTCNKAENIQQQKASMQKEWPKLTYVWSLYFDKKLYFDQGLEFAKVSQIFPYL